jgi:hypothetical protein
MNISMSFSIPEFLSSERSLGIFFLCTVLIGGGAAYQAGRAMAATWRPWWHVVLFMFILGAAVRFIHFALFESELLSPHYYVIDTAFCLIFGLLGFRMMRMRQMVSRYGWINERAGLFSWRRRASLGTEDRSESG